MSRRNQKRTAPRKATGDSIQNLLTRTGIGAGSMNDAAHYEFNPITRNRLQMEAAYRTSWVVGRAVDTVAEDMTREGVEIKGDLSPEDIESLERVAGNMRLWDAICDTVKWSRLYGGAIAVFMIDGQDLSTPLRLETISKGQFKGLHVLDRWLVQPSLTDLVQEFGVDFGKPMYYHVLADAKVMVTEKIHHSRVIRLEGVDLPYWQKISENGWGQSVLERLWDRLVAFDSATDGVAQLVYKAHLRTYKVKGLRDIIAVGGSSFEGLVKQIDLIRQYQSNEGLTLMDAEDEFEAHNFSFAGLPDVIDRFALQISAAVNIPEQILFGDDTGGLATNGESKIRSYYDSISQQQESQLRSGVQRLYGILYRSVFGESPSEDFNIDFKPLWQLNDEQKASVVSTVTDAITKASDAGIIDRSTALKELRQVSTVAGTFSNITDEQIKEAEDEPPPAFGEAEELEAEPESKDEE